MFSKRVLLPLIALIPLMGASALVSAQEQCRPAVAQDFSSLSTACLDSDPNSLCLAQGDAVITRQGESEELAGGSKLPTGDIEDLALGTLSTSSLYPVGYIRTLANLPAAYLEDDVTFLASGAIKLVDNSRQNGEPFTAPLAEVETILSAATDVLSFPPSFTERESSVVGQLPANASVRMDVRTEAGDYVRIAFVYSFGPSGNRVSAWIASEAISDADAVSNLPVMQANQLMPMQSITVPPVEGACQLNTSRLFMQSSGCNVQSEISINGLNMVSAGTALFDFVLSNSGRYTMRITPIMGEIYIVDPSDRDDLFKAIRVIPSSFIEIPLEVLEDANGAVTVSVADAFLANFATSKLNYETGLANGANLIGQDSIDAMAAYTGVPNFLLSYPVTPPVRIVASGVGQVNPIYTIAPLPVCR